MSVDRVRDALELVTNDVLREAFGESCPSTDEIVRSAALDVGADLTDAQVEKVAVRVHAHIEALQEPGYDERVRQALLTLASEVSEG